MKTLALALAVALALVPPLVQASVPMRAIAVGDWAEHRVTQGGSNLSVSRTTVEARERMDGVDAWRVVSRMTFEPNGDPGAITNGTSTLWVRVTDGALVRQKLDSTFGADRAPAVEYHWDSPCAQQPWPLDEGASWVVNCTAISSDGQRYPGEDHRAVVRAENVTVPAGTFHALVIETRDADGAITGREWIAEGACTAVRAETIQPQGAPIVREMTAQHCGATARGAPGFGAAALGLAAAVVIALRRKRA